MPYCNQSILKAFASKNSWVTLDPAPEGLSEAIAQSDDIIYQKIRLAPPADPNDARAILRNIACSIVYWIVTGQQGKLDEQEYTRRKTSYDNAIATLDLIASGEIILRDDSGADILNNAPSSFFKSDSPYMYKL